MVCKLNPIAAPVTIYQNENAGELHPITDCGPDSLCTIQARAAAMQPAMVEKAIEQLVSGPPKLNPSDKNKIRGLLYEFADVISVDGSDLGLTTIVQHEINTGDAKPIHQALRRLPFHQCLIVRELVADMLD